MNCQPSPLDATPSRHPRRARKPHRNLSGDGPPVLPRAFADHRKQLSPPKGARNARALGALPRAPRQLAHPISGAKSAARQVIAEKPKYGYAQASVSLPIRDPGGQQEKIGASAEHACTAGRHGRGHRKCRVVAQVSCIGRWEKVRRLTSAREGARKRAEKFFPKDFCTGSFPDAGRPRQHEERNWRGAIRPQCLFIGRMLSRVLIFRKNPDSYRRSADSSIVNVLIFRHGPHPGLEGWSRPRSWPCLRLLERPSRPLRGASGRDRRLLPRHVND